MSSDTYGLPQRKIAFGRDLGLDGQALVAGARPNMGLYLSWSRADQLVCAGASNQYLLFDVPPLPIGSVIRMLAIPSVATASEVLGVAISSDWLVATPTLSSTFGSTGFSGAAGVDLVIVVTARNNVRWAQRTAAAATTGTAGGAGPLDFAKSNRMGVYGTVGTALTINAAFVEVFIPRVYR